MKKEIYSFPIAFNEQLKRFIKLNFKQNYFYSYRYDPLNFV